MTRAEEIFTLKRRYRRMEKSHQWVAAAKIWVKLHELVNRQLHWETKNVQ